MSVTYTATLPVSEDTALFGPGLLHAERRRLGTRGRNPLTGVLPAGNPGPAPAARRHPDRSAHRRQHVKVNGVWRYVYRAIDQRGQVIDVLLTVRRDAAAARRFFTQALRTLKVMPTEVATDAAPVHPAVLDKLLPAAWHHVEQYANNPIVADQPPYDATTGPRYRKCPKQHSFRRRHRIHRHPLMAHSAAGIDGSAGLNEASSSQSADQRWRWLSRLTCAMLQPWVTSQRAQRLTSA